MTRFEIDFLVVVYKFVVIWITLSIGEKILKMVQLGRAIHHLNVSDDLVRKHQKTAKIILWLSIGLVVIVEGGIRIKGTPTYDTLFFVHAGFVSVYGVTLPLAMYYNGHRSRFHRWIAYLFVFSYLGTANLGLWMLLTRF